MRVPLTHARTSHACACPHTSPFQELAALRSDYIHIDHLAFALPFFTYGPYWGYHRFSETHNFDTKAGRPTHLTKRSSTFLPYSDIVPQSSQTLNDTFPTLYDKLLTGLATTLNTTRDKISPIEGMSLPGFHVIPSHRAWTQPLFRFHYDEMLETVIEEAFIPNKARLKKSDGEEISYHLCEGSSRISFTLPLALPTNSSGLNYVDYSDHGGKECEGESNAHKCNTLKRQVYTPGELVIHAGTLIHSIGEWEYGGSQKDRITMQGFGLRCGGEWFIYW